MQDDDKYKKRKLKDENGETEGESGSGTSGGQSGQIEFRDFLASDQYVRDDALSPEAKKRLLSVHSDAHESRVEKQKAVRDQRALLKSGKLSLETYRQEGMAKSQQWQFKAHAILANKAQFSGIDQKENPLITENIAEANQDKRNELTYSPSPRMQPENTPRFNPRPLRS